MLHFIGILHTPPPPSAHYFMGLLSQASPVSAHLIGILSHPLSVSGLVHGYVKPPSPQQITLYFMGIFSHPSWASALFYWF